MFKFTHSIRDSLKPFYLLAYRLSAFMIITGALIFLLGWVWVMGFFLVNHTWVAPTVLSPTSDKMLQFQAGYLQEQQAVSALTVLRDQQLRAITTNREQLEALEKFSEEISKGNPLLRSKVSDIQNSMKLERGLDVVAATTNKDMANGLITTNDAIQVVTAIQQFKNGTTDGKVAFATLQQQLIQLQVQIATLKDQIQNGILTFTETEKNLQTARAAMKTLDESAYAHAVNDGSNMAFVAYDNIKVAKVGASVYDCYLMIIACHKVGTIRHVYHDELVVDFPLFNVRLSRTVRGVMVDMDVTDPKYMGSTVMFVGKPLFF